MARQCDQGPEVKPCTFAAEVRIKVEGQQAVYSCWRHVVPFLRPVAAGGKAPRMTVKDV